MAKKTRRAVAQKKGAIKKVQPQSKLGINHVVLFIFFAAPLFLMLLPRNRIWLESKIISYYKDWYKESKTLDLETRSDSRQGVAYRVFSYVCKNVPKGSKVLLPPQTYYLKNLYEKNKPEQVIELYNFMAEPNIFCYHCMDAIPITLNMKEEVIRTAEFTIMVDEYKKVRLIKIENEGIYQQLRQLFDLPLEIMTDKGKVIEFIDAQ